MGKKGAHQANAGQKVLCVNRRAKFEYHLLETFEAGIVLQGWEIKSLRAGGGSIAEGYVRPSAGQIFLLGATIHPYVHGNDREVDPKRDRKLLMHKHEIERLQARVRERGLTIVPTRMYLKAGRAKLEIALARGKDAPDKRDNIIERESRRELARAFKGRS